MRPSLPTSFAKIAFTTVLTIMSVALLAGSASAAFTNPPNGSQFTLQGCRNTGQNPLYLNNALPLVCADSVYTSGNLGKGWNELDLVPYRLTATAGGSGTPTYNVYMGADFTLSQALVLPPCGDNQPNTVNCGYDLMTNPVVNTLLSDNAGVGCSVSAAAQFVQKGVTGGTAYTLLRKFTITQPAGSTCVFDWDERLALGSASFNGSDLQAYMFQTDVANGGSTVGKKTVPTPVNQILPQQLSKSMSATQSNDFTWLISKTSQSSADFPNVCPNPAATQTKNITINIGWTKNAATPGNISVTATITATNPASRDITVNVTDNVWVGSLTPGSGTLIHGPVSSGSVLVPAGMTVTVMTDTFTDSNTSDSQFNDIATATYTDVLTGFPIPGQTTAQASTTVQVSGSSNSSAQITDQEDMLDPHKNPSQVFSFALTNATTNPNIGTGSACLESAYTPGNPPSCSGYAIGNNASYVNGLDWLSPSFSGSGTATFTKSIQYSGSGPAAGSLVDDAVLTASGGFSVDSGPVTTAVSAEAQVNLTINKSITPPANVTFTFHVYNSANTEVFDPKTGLPPVIAFTSTGSNNGSVELDGLQPDTYTVTEDAVTGWSETDNNSHAVDLSGISSATCANSVTFANSQPDAYITVTPGTATNEVGNDHVFTYTLTEVPNGATPATTGTITPNITGTAAFTTKNNTCGTVSFTNNVATCSVTVNSTVVNTITANGTGTVTIGGVQLSRSTGDSISNDSGAATKYFVDGSISISPSQTNEVGHQHTFTVTVTQSPGGATAATTANVTVTLTGLTPSSVTDNCTGKTVTFSGNTATCTVVVNSTVAGTITANASATFMVGGVTLTRATGDAKSGDSGPAVKQYVDASIAITPHTATNPVGTPHTFTITVTEYPAGATAATSTSVTYSLTGGTASSISGTCGTTASGTVSLAFSNNVASCTLTINSTTPQTFTLNASASLTIGGVALTRSTTGNAGPGGTTGATKAYQAGQIKIIKNTLPNTVNGTFNFTDNFGITQLTTSAGTANQTSGYLAPGNGYSISETTPNNGTTGFALVPALTGCDAGSTLSAISVVNGGVTTCTFTNATSFVTVVKTVNGNPPGASDPPFSFDIRKGATPISSGGGTIGSIIDTKTTSAGNGTLSFTDLLIPGVTYQMCEMIIPGYGPTFTINGNTAALYSIPDPNGVNPAWMCVDFTTTGGQTLAINVNNVKPTTNGKASTIGFWKNWASCAKSSGGQMPILDQTLFAAKGVTPEPYGPNVQIGALFLIDSGTKNNAGTACTYAVNLLNKSTIDGKSKMASDPAFNMAAQLLGAILNVDSGATIGPNDSLVISEAELLLSNHNFNGLTYTPFSASEATLANNLATLLDQYNNNGLDPTSVPPLVISANTATFTNGTASTFTVTALGQPSPAITESGSLPAGFTFTGGTGTATVSYSGASSPKKSTTISFTATNSAGTFVQSFTIKVQ